MRTITLFMLCLMAQVPAIAQLDTTFFYGSMLAARNGQVVFRQNHGWGMNSIGRDTCRSRWLRLE